MKYNWFTIPYIEEQEKEAQFQFENFFGRGKNGFCDFALDGVELLMQGIFHLTNKWEVSGKDDFVDFPNAFKCFTYYHMERMVYVFKGTYNLLVTGYYNESAILLRHILETFVRLRYIKLSNNVDNIMLAFAGHHKYKGKTFNVSYRKQFDKIAPGLYEFYQFLCGMAHGSLTSHILKSTVDMHSKIIKPDDGIVLKSNEASFIINQYCVYLLANLRFMLYIFPEIKEKMPQFYEDKLTRTILTLEKAMEELSKSEKNKKWWKAVKNLILISP